jgi:spore coat protein U-like protein
MRKNIFLTSLAVALIGIAGTASAGDNPAVLTVQATVTPECIINDANLDFGSVGGIFVQAAVASTQIDVECNDSGVPFSVSLNTGLNGTATGRKMSGSTDMLPYELYSDASLSTPWGDGVNLGDAVSGTSSAGYGNFTSLALYGRIPAGTRVKSFGYTDSVGALVSF